MEKITDIQTEQQGNRNSKLTFWLRLRLHLFQHQFQLAS